MNSTRLMTQRIFLLKQCVENLESTAKKLPDDNLAPSAHEELLLKLEIMTLLVSHLTSEIKHARWNLVDVNSPEFH